MNAGASASASAMRAAASAAIGDGQGPGDAGGSVLPARVPALELVAFQNLVHQEEVGEKRTQMDGGVQVVDDLRAD